MAVETNILPPRYRGPVLIGRGGMGEIYRATDDVLGRVVAVKVLAERFAQDPAIRERFTREALSAARLSGQRNIVTIFDVGEWNERPLIVMEYLSGGTLEERIRNDSPLPVGQVLAWLEQAATALDAAHREGVVHRDVKPGNLLLDRDDVVHVADFGIAAASGMDSLTMTGTVLGTAAYLAPEQARGERSLPASDLYSLGVVAFELLTGARPYSGDTPAAEAAAHVHGEIPPISARRSDLPEHLDRIFHRALAKDPAERFPTGADFVACVRDAVHESAATTGSLPPVPTAATRPLPPPRRRSRALPLAVALLVALLLAAGIAAAALLGGEDDEEPAAKPKATTIVKKVTVEGEPERVTVTAEVAPPVRSPAPNATTAPPAATSATPAGSISEAIALNDESFRLMNQGRYGEALPLAQSALAQLDGTGHRYEAYANYNVGRSLVELGQCEQGLRHIDRSEQLQGHRREFDIARAKCR